MNILGITLQRHYPYLYPSIESGNFINMKRSHGNRNNIVEVKGKMNHIESLGIFVKSRIRIIGNNNSIIIKKGCKITKTTFVIIGNNCKIVIDEDATLGRGCWITLMGEQNEVNIGKGSMIADEVDLWASDSHPIYDNRGDIINPSGSINIGEHVWIGKRSVILKNVQVGNNSIIGMASVVTRSVPESCVTAGNPARVIRENINWKREHIKN